MKQAFLIFCLIFLFGGRSNEAKTVEDNSEQRAHRVITETCRGIDSLSCSINELKRVVQ